MSEEVPFDICMRVWKRSNKSREGNCFCCDSHISCDNWYCAHIVPKKDGGKDIAKNLRPVCYNCKIDLYTHNMYEFICREPIHRNGIKNIPINQRTPLKYIPILTHEEWKQSVEEAKRYHVVLLKPIENYKEEDEIKITFTYPDGDIEEEYFESRTTFGSLTEGYQSGKIIDIDQVNGMLYHPSMASAPISSTEKSENYITFKYTNITDFPPLSLDNFTTENEEVKEMESMVNIFILRFERLLHDYAPQIADMNSTLKYLETYPEDIRNFIDLGKSHFKCRWIKCDECEQLYTHFISPLYHRKDGVDICPSCYEDSEYEESGLFYPETVLVLWNNYNC